jgi:hypothetical protein
MGEHTNCSCQKSSDLTFSQQNKQILSDLKLEIASQLDGVTAIATKKTQKVISLKGTFTETELKDVNLVQNTTGSKPILTGFMGTYKDNDTTRQLSYPLTLAVTALFNKRKNKNFKNDILTAVESGRTQYSHHFFKDLSTIIDELSPFFKESTENKLKTFTAIDFTHSNMMGESLSCEVCCTPLACAMECLF